MSLRLEFVRMAEQEGANLRELCRRYGVSPPTGYKWLGRYRAEGAAGLVDRARRPRRSPGRTPAAVEALVLAERDRYPARGPRKLRRQLQNRGHADLPAPSTVAAILRRHGRVDPAAAPRHRPFERFEHPTPNALWQMDFKGHVPLAGGGRLHPLTVLDDHSRFAICLAACADERTATVRAHLEAAFRRYGLPARMLMDNGSPWGDAADSPWTPLTVWLLRLGVGVSHGRPRHPQTQGKDERFHRTLTAELLRGRPFADPTEAQRTFDAWRDDYNALRPHEALGLAVPVARYRPSPVPFPEPLPPIDYGPGAAVRRVDSRGEVHFRGRRLRVGKGFRGQPVALRPAAVGHLLEVYYCQHRVKTVDPRADARDLDV